MADLTPEQRLNVDEWIGALRSGEYRQTSGALRDKDGYCVWGVACETQGLPSCDTPRQVGSYSDVVGEYEFPDGSRYHGVVADEWAQSVFGDWADRRTLSNLWTMNDYEDVSFDDLADEIKRRAYGA